MRALVTGGAGFLGSAVARRLLARGDGVRCLSRGDHAPVTLTGAEAGAEPGLSPRQADMARGDVADAEAVARALEYLHLGWAQVGAFLRLPGVVFLVTALTDAAGGGPRPSRDDGCGVCKP